MRANFPKRLALLAALAATGCWSRPPADGARLAPELTLERVKFEVNRGGESRATGRAAWVTFRRDTTEIAAADLDLVLSGAEGPVALRAPEASGVTSSRHYVASGGVTAQRGPDVATTASATYDAGPGTDHGLVRGDEPVLVTGPGYRLDGRHFTLDPASGEIVVGGGATLVSGLGVKR